jgi:hypothetical protein
MIRTLRAFVRLRWRVLVNSLRKTGSRDALERFSIAAEQLWPIVAGVLMIPSALAAAVAGTAAGYVLAHGQPASPIVEACRYLLLAVAVLSIMGPLVLPAADRTNPVRLLLLPISRSTLYVAQSSSAFGDPWVVLMLPLVSGIPIGLLAGGAFGAAVLALSSGALLVAAIVGLSSLATSVLHLAVRDKRRGQLLALLFILMIPMWGIMPAVIGQLRHTARQEGGQARRAPLVPTWVAAAGERTLALVPTELYVTSTRAAARGDALGAAPPFGALAVSVLLLHGLGLLAFGRVLDSPGSTAARRAVPMRAGWGRTLPGLSSAASAVALAQVRLVLRSTRGRSIVLSPLIMTAIVGLVVWTNRGNLDFGSLSLRGGLSLAAFGSLTCLTSIFPISLNQFAADGAGLTMALLSPLTDRDYLTGKAVGNALIAGPPALFCLVAAFAAFPGGSPAMWLAIPISLVAMQLIVAPATAIVSALFPRTVNLNSVGRGSNAHGLATLFGLATVVAAGGPCILLTLVASQLLHRPALAPVLLLAWCGLCYGMGRLLFGLAGRAFDRRRENLAMLRIQAKDS